MLREMAMALPENPEELFGNETWSDLSRQQEMPTIDFERMYAYRLARLRQQLIRHDAAFGIFFNPISLRYAVDYRNYCLFQSHIPSTYLFLPQDGPVILYGAYGTNALADELRPGRTTAYFDGGPNIDEAARLLARDVQDYLTEIGSDNHTVAVEYANPSIVQALSRAGLNVIDGVHVSEQARVIKNEDEIACIRWAVAVAEHGIGQMQKAVQPGVREVQLWGLLNYANLANNGDWHEGRMLASGPRINPWLQEASMRQLEAGDLVGFDTDMVGPFGYFADISRTLFCGPGQPNHRQKQLFQLAAAEVAHNMALIRPGLSFADYQQQSYPVAEAFRENAYTCLVHGVGMCDEYPRINPLFRGPNPYAGELEAGMVVCVESYVGAVGERNGVKIEEQILVTEDGFEKLTRYPLDERLLD